jgi:hypothetical protein
VGFEDPMSKKKVDSFRCWATWAKVCLMSVALLPRAATAAQNSSPTKEARPAESAPSEAQLYFTNGVELLQQTPPNYQDAYQQFLIAYEKSNQSWKVLGNLGLCALNLERDGEAATYYRKYLDQGGKEIDANERAAIERELLLVNGSLAFVTFGTTSKKAVFTVRREGSNAPARRYSLERRPLRLGLRAGSYQIAAEADGKKLAWQTVIEPGQQLQHRFDFTESPTAATRNGDSAADDGLSGVQSTGLVTAGAGVVAAVAGLIVGLVAKGDESAARERCDDLGSGRLRCPTATQDDFESAGSLATASTVLLIGGGALAATGLTLVLVGGEGEGGAERDEGARAGKRTARSTRHSPRVSVAPYGGWGNAGLSIAGKF